MNETSRAFLSRLAEDAGMQAELTRRSGGLSGPEVISEEIAELAQSKGYDVSAKDIASALSAMGHRATENGEIAEEELQAVSGGTASWSEIGKAFDFLSKLFGNRP